MYYENYETVRNKDLDVKSYMDSISRGKALFCGDLFSMGYGSRKIWVASDSIENALIEIHPYFWRGTVENFHLATEEDIATDLYNDCDMIDTIYRDNVMIVD